MIEQRFNTVGGLTAPILVYTDYAEADASLKNGLLTQGNNNLVYRQVLPAVRELICNKLEETSGIERKSKVVGKTKAGKDIVQWEPDGEYVNRVKEAKSMEDLTSMQEWLDGACRAFKEDGSDKTEPLAVDIKGVEKTVKAPPRLAQKYKNSAAASIFKGTVEQVNTNLLSKIGKTFAATNDTTKVISGTYESSKGKIEFTNVSEKDAEALGWLLKEYFDWKASQEMDSGLGV